MVIDEKKTFVLINNKTYEVLIVYKSNKYIHYRFKDNRFLITAPRYVSNKSIMDGLQKYGEKLINHSNVEKYSGEDFLMLLGYRIQIGESGEINFSDGSKITYKNREMLERKLKKYFLGLCERRVSHYTKIMDVPLYATRVRKMETRYGSNSLTSRTVCFSTKLMHYSYTRYLENRIRDAFGFQGTPIRFLIRERKN